MTTFDASGVTHAGQVRAQNQDTFYVSDDLVLIADGMGGYAGGEVAAAIAAEVVEASFEGNATPSGLEDAVLDANRRIFERGVEPGLEGMGTTLVAAGMVVTKGHTGLLIVNVGDSRAYLLRAGSLRQLTEDHSVAAELVRMGRIDEGEGADNDPWWTFIRGCDLSEAAFRGYLLDYYTAAPFAPRHLDLFSRYFRALAEAEGPVLIHCAAGKDRTGVLAALTHSLAGVHRDDMLADYLLTNDPVRMAARAGVTESARFLAGHTEWLLRLTAPGGFVFLASCSHNVPAADFAEAARRGLADAGRIGRILREAGAGPDHPVHPALPESAYLKSLTLALD